MDVVIRLREVTYSHDCWGKSERCHPPAIQLEAALEIEQLRKHLQDLHKLMRSIQKIDV